MTLTSQYAWLYNQYPFTNDPNADLLHPDWWITECHACPATTRPRITKPFRPNHFYDEQRLLLGQTYRAGDTLRLTVPPGAAPPGPSSTCSTPNSSRRRRPALHAANVLPVRRRPDRRPRLGRRLRPGHRLRQGTRLRCTSARAPTRSTGTSSSTT